MKVTLHCGFNAHHWEQWGPQPLPAVGDLVFDPGGMVASDGGRLCKVRERRWVLNPRGDGEDSVQIIADPPGAWGGPERKD